MSLVLQPKDALHLVVGIVCIVVCIVVPLYLFRTVAHSVPELAVYAKAETRTHPLTRLLLGHGEWVNTYRDTLWVQRYASVMKLYKQEVAWFAFVEFAGSFALSAVNSATTTNSVGCGHVKLASGIIFTALLALESWIWPHARFRDAVVDVIIMGVQAAAMYLMAIGYYKDDEKDWTFGVASSLLLVAVVLLLARTVVDIFVEIYIIITRRRRSLQEDVLRQLDRTNINHDDMLYGQEAHITPATVPVARSAACSFALMEVTDDPLVTTPRVRDASSEPLVGSGGNASESLAQTDDLLMLSLDMSRTHLPVKLGHSVSLRSSTRRSEVRSSFAFKV
eukprot:TRINITY_DN20910_c0_g1_i1.p1 TRINITY_DN20910_c0_g1~~TRINITY_DN20910_c0_g1_i1.p1  ORF type:complete len:389 (+),score=136.80 TRINITY_DN20910_c0_g1_i1:160-1167(+)